MDQDRLSLLALHFIPGIGDHTIRQLVSYCGSAEKVFTMPKGKLRRIPGIGEITARVISKGDPFRQAEQEILLAEKHDVRLLFYLDKGYPSRLKQISDAPSLLYAKGEIDFEAAKMVAIVGTRNATDYGKQCVEELVMGLVSFGVLIVSGLAFGIDILAHKQALRNALPTIGVMGSGMDIIYPAAHAEVASKMVMQGGLLTELPFGAKPDAHNFPARNRIIAGLCDALVVIEAAHRGGALITADIANSYNKDVFAFPGDIGKNFSKGCNNLIKSNKATLITAVEDLAYFMNWGGAGTAEKQTKKIEIESFAPDEQTIVKVLLENHNQLPIDELSWRTALPVHKIASLLLGLEFRGIITMLPGKVYKLTNP